jgi:hypothetical protein
VGRDGRCRGYLTSASQKSLDLDVILMVASHDQLMHRNSGLIIRQPHREPAVSTLLVQAQSISRLGRSGKGCRAESARRVIGDDLTERCQVGGLLG